MACRVTTLCLRICNKRVSYAIYLEQVILIFLPALDLHLQDVDILIHLCLFALELNSLLGGVVYLSIFLYESSESVVCLFAPLHHHHLLLEILDDLLQLLYPILVQLLLRLQLVLRRLVQLLLHELLNINPKVPPTPAPLS